MRNNDMDSSIQLRQKLLECTEFRFLTDITADYGNETYNFRMNCVADNYGNITFTVISPDSISGISGKIRAEGGEITFDQKVLAFPLIIEGYLSPISAPWVILNCLRSGYLSSCGNTKNGAQIIIDDTLSVNNIQCILWLDPQNSPCSSEIVWNGRRILSIKIENAVFL